MQLTNYSAIDMRHDTAKVLDDRDHSIRKITTGERMTLASTDPGGLAVAMKQDVVNHQRSALRTNLQNARSYVEAQGEGLLKVNSIYDRMSVLATNSLDVALNDGDRADLDIEFQELTKSLESILSEKFNGVRLFDQNVKCGGIQNIPLGSLDLAAGKPWGIRHAVRAQTVDVGTTGGTLTFQVNSGEAPDSYRIYMGGTEVFSTGPAFKGPDYRADYNFDFGDLISGADFGYDGYNFWTNKWQGGWSTSGSANPAAANYGDSDTFKVSFGPGVPTTYDITYGASNVGLSIPWSTSSNPTQGQLKSAGGEIRTSDLSPGSTSTELTLQIEVDSTSIGVVQPGVSFEPSSEDKDLIIGENGESMELTAKGFSTMSGYDIKSVANAQKTLNKLAGDANSMGEADCVLYERLGAVRAEAARLDDRLHELGDQLVQGEAAYGRIADLDYAKEMTRFATNSLQLNVMSATMGSAIRATDVLMPLTTQQFQSAVTQHFQLL